MKKISKNYNDEINLIELVMILWSERIKIILITVISFLIFFGFNYFNQPKNNLFEFSLNIKPNKDTEFIKLRNVHEFLKRDSKKNLNLEYFNQFLEELMDYEELVFILNINESFKKEISNLSIKDQTKKLFIFAEKNLEIIKLDVKNEYVLKFLWHNKEEGENILDQLLNLTITNLEKSIYQELEQLIELKKNKILQYDKHMINMLKEQSLIARELEIEEKLVEVNSPFILPTYDNTVDSESKKFLDPNIHINTYYLRGYKAIDKEINIIKNRKYENLSLILKDLNLIKSLDIKWIDYNIFLLKKSLQNNSKDFEWIFSILIGFVLGIIYIIFSNALKNFEVKVKKTK